MNRMWQDLRYALRQLRKSPGFTLVAVLTLALGIGANTAIFTVLNALLLKMLPVRNPQELVVVGDPANPNSRSNGTPRTDLFSYPLYKEFRDRNTVFRALTAAATDHRVELHTGREDTSDEKVNARMVSGNYFNVLGLEPAAGRLLSDSDDTAESANPVVVLSYAYWGRKFAFSPSIIGKDILLNGYPFDVVGVAPWGFAGDVVEDQMSIFVPLSMQPQIIRGRHFLQSENVSWLLLIGRLKQNVTPAQAEADLNVVFRQALNSDYGAAISADDRKAIRDEHIHVAAGGGGFSQVRSDYKTPMLLLMGMVGLVLLIACVNVANLLLARASSRGREIAIRLAMGANPNRILQQLLTESILLGMAGGGVGSLLAIWGVRFLTQALALGVDLPVAPDWRVLVFTVAVSVATGMLFGLFPALQTLRVQVSPTLKDGTRTTVGTGSRFGWSKRLIVGQVALSLLVLFAAGLMVRSLQNLIKQDFGYERDSLVIARIDAVSVGYKDEKMNLLADQLVNRIAATSGVRAVTYSANGLFSGSYSADQLIVPGFTATDSHPPSAAEDYVGPGYFQAMGIPILAGRGIELQDTATSTRVAVINEAMVKHFFNGLNPLGRQFTINDPQWLDKPLTIIGVSRNTKERGETLREDVDPEFYFPFQQSTDRFQIVLEVQAAGKPSAATANVISQIKAVDPQLPISFVRTLDDLIDSSASTQIALAKMSSFFAGLALLLACVGLYGVMSYTVAGRTREIGLRMALGASRIDVMKAVLREAMLLVGFGLLLGIPLSLASARLLSSFLFHLTSADPVSLSSVTVALGIVAAAAGFIPARRASSVDPMVALRYE